MDSIEPLGFLSTMQPFSYLSVLLVPFGFFAYLFVTYTYNLFFHPLRNYPGPLLWRVSSIPFAIATTRGTLQQEIRKIHEHYGDTVRIQPFELSYTNAQAWKDIYAHKPGRPEFSKDPYRYQKPMNGVPNILGADKENHDRYRRLLAHAFSEKGLREQESHIRDHVDLLIDRLGEIARADQEAEMVSWYTMITFDVVGDLAYGESFDSLRNRKLHRWIEAILGSLRFLITSDLLRRAGVDFLIPYFLPQKLIELRKQNYAFTVDKVQRRLQHTEERGDFWDKIVKKSANDNESGEGMSLHEMVSNSGTLILAGSETSASTLSGATYLLTSHPETLKQAVHEVRSTFKSSKEINLISVNSLRYLTAVIEETMRFYPPVPGQGARLVPEDGAVVCGNFVPAKTSVSLSPLAAYRSANNFHRPDEFLPERWLNTSGSEFANDDRAVFQPFSLGTRNCIGRNLAYAEMRLVLASVLWHFDLTLNSEKTGDFFDQNSWGVWVKNDMYVNIKAASH